MNAINQVLCDSSYDTEQARGLCVLTKKTLRIPGANLSVFSFQTRGKGELRRNTKGFWWICTDEIGFKCNVTYRGTHKYMNTSMQVSKPKWNLKGLFYTYYSFQHSDLLTQDYRLIYFPQKSVSRAQIIQRMKQLTFVLYACEVLLKCLRKPWQMLMKNSLCKRSNH